MSTQNVCKRKKENYLVTNDIHHRYHCKTEGLKGAVLSIGNKKTSAVIRGQNVIAERCEKSAVPNNWRSAEGEYSSLGIQKSKPTFGGSQLQTSVFKTHGSSFDNPGSVFVMSLKITIAAKRTKKTNAA